MVRGLVIGLLALGCGRAAPAPEVAFGPASAAEVVPLEAESTIRELVVLEAGAEPRRLLRYRLVPGTVERMLMQSRARAKLIPLSGATTRVHVEANIEAVSPEGVLVKERMIQATMDMPSAGKSIREEQEKLLAGWKREPLGVTFDEQGRPLDAPPSSIVALQVTPFPPEPIGVGARWRTKSRGHMQGIVADVTATYELVSVEGDVVRLKVETHMNAPRQQLMPPAHLVKMEGTAIGERVVDLRHLLPREDKSGLQTSMAMGMPDDETMSVDVRADITVRSE